MRVTVALWFRKPYSKFPVVIPPDTVRKMIGLDKDQWKTFRAITRKECSGIQYSEHHLLDKSERMQIWNRIAASLEELKMPKIDDEVSDWAFWDVNRHKWEIEAYHRTVDAWKKEFSVEDYKSGIPDRCFIMVQKMIRKPLKEYIVLNDVKKWKEIPQEQISAVTRDVNLALAAEKAPKMNDQLLGFILRRYARNVFQNRKTRLERAKQKALLRNSDSKDRKKECENDDIVKG